MLCDTDCVWFIIKFSSHIQRQHVHIVEMHYVNWVFVAGIAVTKWMLADLENVSLFLSFANIWDRMESKNLFIIEKENCRYWISKAQKLDFCKNKKNSRSFHLANHFVQWKKCIHYALIESEWALILFFSIFFYFSISVCIHNKT